MVATETQNSHTVIKPEGRITAANAETFRKELLDIIESGQKELVIDLNQVEILDSKGLAVFIVCHKSLTEIGGSLTVVTDNSDFQGLFRVMRLDQHFKICGSDEI